MISGQTLASFNIESRTGRVVLRMNGYGDLELGWQRGLRGARGQVDFILSKFRAAVMRTDSTLETLAKAIRDLDRDMGQLAFMLVRDSDNLLRELRRRFVDAWPQWQHDSDVVPVVEVRGHDEEFPFELLPLFDATDIDDLVNYAEAENAMRRFLGYAAAIRRVPSEEIPVEPLHATPKLGIQFIRYDMDGTVTEAAYFGRLRDKLHIDGPWPPEGLEGQEVTTRLIDVLFDPRQKLISTDEGNPIQVQHFACHAETDTATDTGYALILGHPDRGRYKITLGTIRHGFRTREEADQGPRPLVIANACGSSAIDPQTRRSFPHWFLANRHRGFVGTETDVPDKVAAQFAERLYDEMLSGRPLGEAIVLARRRLMAERSNPLGLLYVLYGDPALVLDSSPA